DDEGHPLERERRLDGRKAEKVADHDLCCIDRMDPPSHTPEIEFSRQDAPVSPKAQRPRSEPADVQLYRARAEQDDAERTGTGRDRGHQCDGAQAETSAPGAHRGVTASASARSIASSPRVPAARASGATITRCESTARATPWTSSGTT